MKEKLLVACLLGSSIVLNAQNVGINNPNPLFPLTFNANLGDKICLWTDGTQTHYGFGIQSGVLQMFSKTNLDDIAFGYGSSTSFVETMRIKGNGRVGIGTTNPNAPLGFPPFQGKKITLYPGATGDVGMAVQGNLLQIYADNPNADIAFGYDQGGTMTERMRITGTGNVGIGMYPFYPLDINGRMRLSGTNPNDPGIWLNDGGTDRAFVGMENNNYVGFYGNQGAGWKFVMNNATGALKVNGSEGVAGQVLTSNGSGSSATWATILKPFAISIKPTLFSTLDGILTSRDVDGLNNTPLTLNQPSTVYYTLTLPINGAGPGPLDSKGYVVVEIVDGSSTRVSYASAQYYVLRSTETTQIATGVAGNLPAGNYTIRARMVRSSPADGDVYTHGSFNSNQQGIQFIAQVIPN